MVYDQRWKTARRNSFYVLARCNISIWTKSLPPLTDCDSSAAKIANWRHGGSWVEPLPITEKEWQVRHGDQPWYPHVLWPLRWTIAHSTWMVPLQFVIWYKPKTGKYTAKRGFTSIQVVHTHTLAQNWHCEFCCGVHLTRKNNPVTTPDRKGSLKGPENQWEALIAIASVVAIANEAKKPNLLRHADCENRTGKKVDIRLTSKCLTCNWKTARWFLG